MRFNLSKVLFAFLIAINFINAQHHIPNNEYFKAKLNLENDFLHKIELHRIMRMNYAYYISADLNGDGQSDLVCIPYSRDNCQPDLYYNYTSNDSIILQIDTTSFYNLRLPTNNYHINWFTPDSIFFDYCFFDIEYDGDMDLIGIKYIKFSYEKLVDSIYVYENNGTLTNPSFTGMINDTLLNRNMVEAKDLYGVYSVDINNDNEYELLGVYKDSLTYYKIFDLFKWSVFDSTAHFIQIQNYIRGINCIEINKVSTIQADYDSLADIFITDERMFDGPGFPLTIWFENSIYKSISISDSVSMYQYTNSNSLTGLPAVLKTPNRLKNDLVLNKVLYDEYIGEKFRTFYKLPTDSDFFWQKRFQIANSNSLTGITLIPTGKYKTDLLLAQSGSFEHFYNNSGIYTYSTESIYPTFFPSCELSGFHLADFDGDNDLDLLLGEDISNDPYSMFTNLYIYWNVGSDSNWTWSGYLTIKNSSDVMAFDPYAIDWDNDNDIDLFVSVRKVVNYALVDSLYYVENIGSISSPHFSNNWKNIPNIQGRHPCLGDINGDARPELFTSQNGKITLHNNKSTPNNIVFVEDTLVSSIINSSGMPFEISRLADLDNDNSCELILAENSQNFYYFELDSILAFRDLSKIVSQKLILNQNYPNPFNSSTIVSYEIPSFSKVEIIIYDILGQKVKTLLSQKTKQGQYKEIWNGKNENDQHVASGIYFCILKTKALNSSNEINIKTSKLVVLR